jgi:TonB family protein
MKAGFPFRALTVAACLTLCCLPFVPPARSQDRGLTLEAGPGARNGRRVALVIGNGAYDVAPLNNPVNDAQDMAQSLRQLGFDVLSGSNLTQREMRQLIREFGQKIKGGGVGLFYYAGHGMQVKGQNYLIPVGADIQAEADVEDLAVSVNLVLNVMDDAGNGLNIVVLDACRNNPFARSFRSAAGGLAQVDAPTGTLIAYATAPGSVASDGTSRNGLYTQELLKFMRTPGLDIENVFKQVRISVRTLTQGRQTPWEASSLVGDFYFTGAGREAPASSAATPANPSPTDSSAFELSYWDSIKNSTDPEDFKAYLRKYPDGQFADLARRKAGPTRTRPESNADAGSGQAAPQTSAKREAPSAESGAGESTKQQGGNARGRVVSGGVLNGKATSLPAPEYPREARAANASGTVTVQVLVDEEGRVVSADAMGGHPLLRQAAVAAARQARFSPLTASGQPVKVSGILTYNFKP